MGTLALPRCPGCDCDIGEIHDPVCDVARCRATGLQWQVCDHQAASAVPHDRDAWTGRYPGEAECTEFGWFARLVPGEGWIECDAQTPGAQPDLNRLQADGRWDASAGRWTRDATVPPAAT